MSDEPSTARILAAIAEMRSEISDLRVALMGRMERVQDALTAHQDDSVVNHGAIERVEGIARSASAEVRAMGEEVSGMRRQIQRLQTQVRELRGEP